MTAQVYNLRDYQSAKDRERMAKMAKEILSQIDTAPSEMIPSAPQPPILSGDSGDCA